MNITNPFCIGIDMDALAEQIVAANYGEHRLLSALVRAIRKHRKDDEGKKLATGIETLLNKGLF